MEDSVLYQTMVDRLSELSGYREQLRSAFVSLRSRVREEMSYVKVAFPEFTPHDEALHLENLFTLADRVLGSDLYKRINPAELVLLVFGLYSHDWGMAVSQDERNSIEGRDAPTSTALLSDDQQAWQVFQRDQLDLGRTTEEAWREYIRRTHGRRSAVRLREQLTPLGAQFADAVARLAEGHTRDMRDIRDPDLYPMAMPILGQPVNLAALAITFEL